MKLSSGRFLSFLPTISLDFSGVGYASLRRLVRVTGLSGWKALELVEKWIDFKREMGLESMNLDWWQNASPLRIVTKLSSCIMRWVTSCSKRSHRTLTSSLTRLRSLSISFLLARSSQDQDSCSESLSDVTELSLLVMYFTCRVRLHWLSSILERWIGI